MLAVLSPSERMDFSQVMQPPAMPLPNTRPELPETGRRYLENLIRPMSGEEARRFADVAAELGLGKALDIAPEAPKGRPDEPHKEVLLAFRGRTYDAMDAEHLDRDDLLWAQEHLRILSGVYGLYRPLDRVPQHTLEIDARLRSDSGDQREFWAGVVGPELDSAAKRHREPVVVNLMIGEEYERAREQTGMTSRVINLVFQQEQGGGALFVKQMDEEARGLMARWIVRNRIEEIEQLKQFDEDGYRFLEERTKEDTLVFSRPLPKH